MWGVGMGGWVVIALAVAIGPLACGPPSATTAREAGPREAGPRPDGAAGGGGEAAEPAPGWLKGQLHLHSNASGDSDTPPARVARWYADHDYDFIVFTDHDRITEIDGPPGLLVFAGIELTQNLETCDPAPEPGLSCLLHVNGLFVGPDTTALRSVVGPASAQRLELYDHALRVTEALGGLAMLDHPNFHYAADADLLSALAGRGLTLLEVANEAWDSNNQGDATHPSTEALWDAVLSTGARVWGVATDDAHHYYDALELRERGQLPHTGDRGWVMVRARPDRASIRAAIERGDFYATNGVMLDRVDLDGESLQVAVDEDAKGSHRFELIGDGGRVLQQQRGREVAFAVPPGHAGYLRVRVQDRRGRRAWTQPVWP